MTRPQCTPARVIGIGQPFAGDDGVGPAVLARLREICDDAEAELVDVADAVALIPLLETDARVIIVDALAGGRTPGAIHVLTPDEIARAAWAPVSSHGVTVCDAIGMARALYPGGVTSDVLLVGIEVTPSRGFVCGLSADVARAVAVAAATVASLARERCASNEVSHA